MAAPPKFPGLVDLKDTNKNPLLQESGGIHFRAVASDPIHYTTCTSFGGELTPTFDKPCHMSKPP